MPRIETVCRENGGGRIVKETLIIIGDGVLAVAVIAVVEGAGHFPFYECPDAFSAIQVRT